jgi:5-methyltetrahydrofolate--homocysteine methyltransferase
MTAAALEQEPRPLLIGERLNTQGSRRMKRLALEGTLEDMVPMAREQVEGGAHVLDLCLALTERTDEAAQMRALVKRLSLSVEAPLCIDSTEAHVIDEALQACPGSAIVNSINLENGRERIDAVMPLVMRYGAAVIALTIDETGMAKTARAQARGGARIHDIVDRSSACRRTADLRRPHVHARHRRRGVPRSGSRRIEGIRASSASCRACSRARRLERVVRASARRRARC